MENLKSKNFALFFTRNFSLQKWDTLGMLDREVKLYQELANAYKTVYLCTYGTRDKSYAHLFPENVVIIERPRWVSGNLYSILLPFIQTKIFRSIDILKTNQMDGSWAAVIAKKLFRKKLIIRCGYEWLYTLRQKKSSWIKRIFARTAESYAYRNADRIIMTTQNAVQFVKKEFSIPDEKFLIIPNYVDTDLFFPHHEPQKECTVTYVGRLEEEKNLLALIGAMEGVNASLVLVGEGSMKEKLRVVAKEKKVPLLLKGSLPQQVLAEEINRSSVFILPSLYEGNPKALLEAMACGIACIGTNVPGIREIIDNGRNGILCEIEVESIRNALTSLLKDEEKRSRLGAEAHGTILGLYSLEHILRQEINAYRHL